MKRVWSKYLIGNKSATILIAGTALIIFLILTLHLSLFESALISTKRVYQLAQKFESLDSIDGQIGSLMRENETLNAQLSLMEQKQDRANRLSGVMALINKGIEVNKLIAVSIKTLSEKARGDFLEQPLELHLTGNYHSFGKFIDSLEQGQIPVRILKLDISARDMVSPFLDLKLSLSFYLLKGKDGGD